MFRFPAVAVLGALLVLAALTGASDPSPLEDARIEYLLTVVASLQDAQFIRNGKTYDSKAAVDHCAPSCAPPSTELPGRGTG